MKHIGIKYLILIFLFSLCWLLALIGCSPQPLSTTPAAAPANSLASPGVMIETSSPPSPSLVLPQSTALTPAPPVTVKTKPAEISVTTNSASLDFPYSIDFKIAGSSTLPVTNITLEYGTNIHSLVDEVTKVQPDFGSGIAFNTHYIWEMKKTGSLPPKAEVWYQWRLIDNAQRVYTTPRQILVFDDVRFQWELESTPDLNVYYYDQDVSMVSNFIADVQSNFSRVNLDLIIPPERKIKVLLYRNYNELRTSGLFKQDWVGGQAFPDYNTIMLAVNSSIIDWAKGALSHEITHLRVGEYVYGPFGDLPVWLNEGLAEYSIGPMNIDGQQVLAKAFQDENIISIRTLASSFPTDPNQANLSYIESNSFVSYLVDTYGWDKMKTLLTIFKNGSTYDNALKQVYGSDTNTLDQGWRAVIKAQ
jgi:hypothetical protein